MATLWITEFDKMVTDANANSVPVGLIDSAGVVEQAAVSFSGSSTQSAALAKRTRLVRVIADTDCHIKAGADPTADTNSLRLEANVAEYFGVQERSNTVATKIAVIAGS